MGLYPNSLCMLSALVDKIGELPSTASLYAYLLMPVILALFVVTLWKGRKLPFMRTGSFMPRLDGKSVGILICALIFAVALALVLSLCWVQHDDWVLIRLRSLPLCSRVRVAIGFYIFHVSRFPDLVLHITGLSLSCWEKVVLTPLMTALIPFALFRLTKRSGDSILNVRGAVFYAFFFCLCLVGVCTEPWRNYWCWAAVVNYLLVALYTLFFLSFYRSDQLNKPDSILSISGMFLLGLACGWGNECIAVLLVPGLCLYAVYSYISRRKWSISRYAGCLGVIGGAVMLFASPSLVLRRMGLRDAVSEKIHHFSPEWVHDFITDFSWEKMSMLEAGKQYYLYDLPIMAKLRVLPFFIDYYWSCCMVGCVAFVTLAVLTVIRNKGAFKTIGGASAFFAVSWVMAAAYLQSVIPQKMSFCFPCILIMAGVSFMFLRLNVKTWVSGFLSVCMFAATAFILGPSVLEACHYKKYEKMRFADIERQRAEGIVDVVLPFRPDRLPENKTCMIGYSWYDLPDQVGGYPNASVAKIMGVRSIRQLRPWQDISREKRNGDFADAEVSDDVLPQKMPK